MNEILSLVGYFVVWFLFWFLGWGGLYLFPKEKIDYINGFKFISIYFLIVSFICLFYFRNIFGDIYNSLTIFPFIILGVFFVLTFFGYFFSRKFLKKPINFIEKYSDVTFLRLEYRYLISKSFDIVYQQILIIALVLLLHKAGLNLVVITIIFAIIFGFAHIPIVRIHKGFFGYFFIVSALFSSFLFPFLIITFKYGFVYTYIAHLLFYTNSGIFFWILKRESESAKEINISEEKLDKIKIVQIDLPETIDKIGEKLGEKAKGQEIKNEDKASEKTEKTNEKA